jgi:predicted glycosyltransferase
MTARILIHVQHLLGTGHVRRAAALGAAAAALDFEVEIVSGGPPIAGLDLGRATLTQLPPLRSLDAGFKQLVGETGAPIDEAWKTARRDILLRRFAAFKPDVLVTELFPFGRRAIEFELLPLLDAARATVPRPLVLCSLRDILVAPRDPVKVERTLARVRDSYDGVLVHGDPALIDLPASYPPAAALGEKIFYTGYVPSPDGPQAPAGDGVDEIVVSSGGSAVGAKLLETALAARRSDDRLKWRLLFGPDLPAAARARLQAQAGPHTIVEPARQDFPSLLRRCHVSVSQAGYNTAMDILDARARAVLVPFATDGETEQTQRAVALAERGWAQVVHEPALDAAVLRAAIERAAAMGRPDTSELRRDGAATSARYIRDRLARRRAP